MAAGETVTVRFTAGEAEPELVKMTVSPFTNARGMEFEMSQFAAVVSQMLATPSPAQTTDCGRAKLVLTTEIVPLVARGVVFHIRSDASDGRLMLANEPP